MRNQLELPECVQCHVAEFLTLTNMTDEQMRVNVIIKYAQ